MQDGWTPLDLAAANGHLEIVQLLLRHRADKELKNNDGEKPVDIVNASPFTGSAPGRQDAHPNPDQHNAAITALLR